MFAVARGTPGPAVPVIPARVVVRTTGRAGRPTLAPAVAATLGPEVLPAVVRAVLPTAVRAVQITPDQVGRNITVLVAQHMMALMDQLTQGRVVHVMPGPVGPVFRAGWDGKLPTRLQLKCDPLLPLP